jgi:hypothetical protein
VVDDGSGRQLADPGDDSPSGSVLLPPLVTNSAPAASPSKDGRSEPLAIYPSCYRAPDRQFNDLMAATSLSIVVADAAFCSRRVTRLVRSSCSLELVGVEGPRVALAATDLTASRGVAESR